MGITNDTNNINTPNTPYDAEYTGDTALEADPKPYVPHYKSFRDIPRLYTLLNRLKQGTLSKITSGLMLVVTLITVGMIIWARPKGLINVIDWLLLSFLMLSLIMLLYTALTRFHIKVAFKLVQDWAERANVAYDRSQANQDYRTRFFGGWTQEPTPEKKPARKRANTRVTKSVVVKRASRNKNTTPKPVPPKNVRSKGTWA